MNRGHNYQFKGGDLLEVAPLPKYMEDIRKASPGLMNNYSIGPRIPGYHTAKESDLPTGHNALALSDAKKSKWSDNYKLYVDVMTINGPRMAWCNTFKMRKKAEENK
jgi:hypothetical protein